MSSAEAIFSGSSAERPLETAVYEPLEHVLRADWDEIWRKAYVHAREARLNGTLPVIKPDPRDSL